MGTITSLKAHRNTIRFKNKTPRSPLNMVISEDNANTVLQTTAKCKEPKTKEDITPFHMIFHPTITTIPLEVTQLIRGASSKTLCPGGGPTEDL